MYVRILVQAYTYKCIHLQGDFRSDAELVHKEEEERRRLELAQQTLVNELSEEPQPISSQPEHVETTTEVRLQFCFHTSILTIRVGPRF